ncbi:MAG: ChbG/HpnK family deacetylase [Lachnospiraceae bacterium]|nr:ChbG/HpnK family deacetylase [Lachnospiraceae bacterium]
MSYSLVAGTIELMMRTIVNGDDFGISHEVNLAIAEAFRRGILTGTTLMVNMPFAEEAAELSKKEGFYGNVGLHLNLTAGEPLTKKIRELKRFCSSEGKFNAVFQKSTATRLKIRPEESEAVKEEAEAQIRRYLSFGFPARHLDSHHHVHTDLSVWNELEGLLKKYDFRSVRLSRNLFRRTNIFNALYKKRFNRRLKKTGMFLTDYFGSFKDLSVMGRRVSDNALVEVMLHPMYSGEGALMDTKTPMEEVEALFKKLRAQRTFYQLKETPRYGGML